LNEKLDREREKLAMLESIIQSFDDELQLIEDDKDAYLPDFGPDPEVWLAMDEADRISRVSAYHKAAGFKAGSLRAHATIHTAVENQVALGDETPAAVTLDRLMAEGLDRHDAIHAIGRFLLILLSDMQSGSETGDVNARYEAELNTLTAKKWRSGAYDVTEDRRPPRSGRLPPRRRRR
jgi:hypothetical protein